MESTENVVIDASNIAEPDVDGGEKSWDITDHRNLSAVENTVSDKPETNDKRKDNEDSNEKSKEKEANEKPKDNDNSKDNEKPKEKEANDKQDTLARTDEHDVSVLAKHESLVLGGPKMEWVVQDNKVRNARHAHLATLYNNPRYADCRLIPQVEATPALENIEGTSPSFCALRALLASWSPVFDSIFFTSHPESFGHAHQDGDVRVEATSDVVELFLKYIHLGEVTLTMGTIWPFYCFVNTYQISDLPDAIEEIMDQAVSVETCCQLLASAAQLGSYDHYALRKCLNMLLMDYAEVAETPGFLTLDFDVLCAILGSDELNASEECVFEGCMRWISADDQRVDKYLDTLIGTLRLPLMDMKYVTTLDTHPIASRSKNLSELMLEALKFAVSPKRVSITGNPNFKQRKGGLYFRKTKNNMCMDIGSSVLKTFLLNTSCAFIESWKLKIETFGDEGSFVIGICEDSCDTDYYIGRFKDGWGLADNGHFYAGGCKCDASVKHLCTPLCQGHMPLGTTSIVSVCFSKETSDLMYRVGQKVFTQRLADVGDRKLYPAVSLKNAKARIFREDAEILE